MNDNFVTALQSALKLNRLNDWQDNYDYRRFGAYRPPSWTMRAKTRVKALLQSFGMYHNKVLESMLAHEADLQRLYESLCDEESRQVLVNVLAYRVLGHRRVKLPLNTLSYWKKLDELESKANSTDSIDLGFLGWKVDRYDLEAENYPIQVYARAPAILTQMVLQQYRCETQSHVIEVGLGDVVIDAGGCYGDTALYFAHKAAAMGKVFSFEFMPDNIKVFERNLQLNESLAERIEIIPNPLWSTSGDKLFVEGVGPAAHITQHPKLREAKQVETLTIDDLVAQKQLSRLDFIKMDIEGAELEALKGAEDSIRRYRPKLAISVYHHLPDFWEISQWIDGLGFGYCFYLRHFTIHAEETVLFAEVPADVGDHGAVNTCH